MAPSRLESHPGALRWLQEQQFDRPALQIVLQEMVEAARLAKDAGRAARARNRAVSAGLVARPDRQCAARLARRRPDRRGHVRQRRR